MGGTRSRRVLRHCSGTGMNIDALESLAIDNLPVLDGRRFKHVSIILNRSTPIAIGANKRKTHPLALTYKYRFNEIHSELDAWLKVNDRRKKFTLVNFRFGHMNQWRMARPCTLCMPWCKELFKEIYYTTRHGLVREV